MIQTECSTDVENGREVIVYIIFTPFTFRVTRIRANLPACHKEWRSKAALLQIMCSLMSWDRERYDLISSWKLTLLFAWFGCTDDSKDTTRHANKTTCTCWSTSGVVSGLLGCIKTLSCVRVREHMDELWTTLLGGCIACKPWSDEWNQIQQIDFQGWATSGTHDFLLSILQLPHLCSAAVWPPSGAQAA